jgi:hypothetical protein
VRSNVVVPSLTTTFAPATVASAASFTTITMRSATGISGKPGTRASVTGSA